MRNVRHHSRASRQPLLVISRNPLFRSGVSAALKETGYSVHEAEGRADGLALMYRIHPALILLESVSFDERTWSTLVSIRAIAEDTPLLLLTKAVSGGYEERCKHMRNVELMSLPVVFSNLADQIGNRLGQSNELGSFAGMRRCEPSERTLEFLDLPLLHQLEHALERVGESGEVRLIKRNGLLRFIATVKTIPYRPGLV